MTTTIGIRRETKNQWERRTPLTPTHIQKLKNEHNIHTTIESSPNRIFTDEKYEQAGASIATNLNETSLILAVKEIPPSYFQPHKTYVFFSHTIKGQTYNMPMLKRMMDLECNLIDYERIIDTQGRRLVFFGRYAGLAGMIDTLWGYGQQLKKLHISTPLTNIKQTIHYGTLEAAKEHLHYIGQHIKKHGLPTSIKPLVIGFAGYGHVSQGAQEILDLFPHKEIKPSELPELPTHDPYHIYKVVFKEHHLVTPKHGPFQLHDYYQHPDKYTPIFDQYLPYLTILMNCIYWDTRYPRLVTKNWLKDNTDLNRKLKIIGDISVDINGAIEFTEKVTTPDNPCYVYNPHTNTLTDGPTGKGIAVMAIDNLPTELPRAASIAFSKALYPLIPPLTKTDFTKPTSNLTLPKELHPALILHHGHLTKEYQYIDKYL